MDKFLLDLSDTLNNYYSSFVDMLPRLVLAIVVFMIAIYLANLIRRIVSNRITPNMDDPLLARFLSRVVKTIVLVTGVLFVLEILGLGGIASGLLASAGVSAFVIGFAFKDIGENFLAGILLAFNRPFRVGDTVELDGQKGVVVTLNLRNSQIKTFDGKDIYIPNANVVKNPVINYTIDGFLRHNFSVGLDYGSDVEKAMSLIYSELKNIRGILHDSKKPSISVGQMGASALNLDIFFWIDTFDKSVSAGDVKNKAIIQVLTRLNSEGFYLPGDIIELKNYQSDTLKTGNKQGNVV